VLFHRTHCNTLQHTRHVATHCSMMMYYGTHVCYCVLQCVLHCALQCLLQCVLFHRTHKLQHTATHATHCNTLLYDDGLWYTHLLQCVTVCCNVCCFIAHTHCNTLQHTRHTATHSSMMMDYSAHICCSVLQRVLHGELFHCTHTLQHTATHCNTLISDE